VDVSGKARTSLRQVRDFPETSPTCLGEVSGKSWTSRGSLGEVRVMEFGLKQTKKKVYILRRLTAVYLAFCFVVIDNVMLL